MAELDLVIAGGTIHDGSGEEPYVGDVLVARDRIPGVTRGGQPTPDDVPRIDATGFAVAPGFVNMLSHSFEAIWQDARSMGELVQGVTTQVMGEAYSMGPWNDETRAAHASTFGLDPADVFSRLHEAMAALQRRGTSQNVASFVGATTLREQVLGTEQRAPTKTELDAMVGLAAEEAADGALGIGSALIYAPGSYAGTDELTALARATAPYGGRYISHLRSEGNQILEAIDELLAITRKAEVGGEIWHMKVMGRRNWDKLPRVIERVESARNAGQDVTTNMYPYTAGGTALAASIPPWAHEGGLPKLFERLADPTTRARIVDEIAHDTDDWENLYQASGGGTGIQVLYRDPDSGGFVQRWLSDVAVERSVDPIDCLLDLVLCLNGAVGAMYYLGSEDNLRTIATLPWCSYGSDAASTAAEGERLGSLGHPRAYGTFARVLGSFVREEHVLTLQEAVRKLTSLPCDNLGLVDRGRVREGCFADLVIFDPEAVADTATYENAHSYATGVRDVIVNGTVTLRGGKHTGEFGGRAIRRGK